MRRANLSAAFVLRPKATSLLTLLVVVLGAAAYVLLPIAALPQVDLPTIQVSAGLPGASAEVMARAVTTPLERSLALVSGVTELTSTSSQGNSSITLQFDLDRDIDAAAQDVQTALDNASGELPRTLPHPPSYEKANPADFQVLSIAMTSDTLPLREVDRWADTMVAQQLSRIPGVGLIDLHGEQHPAVRVQIDPRKIAALGIGLEQIRAVLGSTSVDAPTGTLDNPRRSVEVHTTDQLARAAQFDDVVIAWRNGAPVRVRDVGRAIDGVANVRQAAWLGRTPAIIVDVHKEPGSNVPRTVDAIRARLPELAAALPPGIAMRVVADRTQTIRAALAGVQWDMLVALALVVLSVWAFLRGLWATLIPAIAIPVSVLGTFAAMQALGYTLNNLTLMGLTVAVGFLVDDAIVVIENIARHMEQGEGALRATLEGARQVGFTVVSMTLSLIAAFIPLLLMGGVVGRMFREFSVTISVALLISAAVSLSLTPALCRILLPRDRVRPPGRIAAAAERLYLALHRGYARSLDAALAHRGAVLWATLGMAAASAALYVAVPKGFVPQQDNGSIQGSSEAPVGIGFEDMARRQLALVQVLQRDPDVADTYSWIGESATPNEGRTMILLKPFDQRRARAARIIDRLQPQLAEVGGIAMHMRARQDLEIGGRGSRTQFQYTLEDQDAAELYAWTPRVQQALAALPQIRDLNSDLADPAPGLTLAIDRARAAQFGVSPQLLDDTLYDALGQRQVATIDTDTGQDPVILETTPDSRLDADGLAAIELPAADGHPIPLATFARLQDGSAPLEVNHQDQFPAVTLSFNLAPGASLGGAVDAVDATLRELRPPATLHAAFAGTARTFLNTVAGEGWLIAAAIFAVYVVLGVLYESYVHPLTILSALPSAGLGALLALLLLGLQLDLIALIGIILLIGLVKKNAIMMIDFALEAERDAGLDQEAAIRSACLARLRPILMTTAAAIFGALPLAFGNGAGAELRLPLGVAIVGGLLVSQVLTLYTTPVVYLALGGLGRRLSRR